MIERVLEDLGRLPDCKALLREKLAAVTCGLGARNFLLGPSQPHKHKELTFRFHGPIEGGYQKSCLVGSSCLYYYTILHTYTML